MFAPFHHEHLNRDLVQYVIELLPKLSDMIAKDDDQTTFTILAKLLIRTGNASAATAVIKALERGKEKRDSLDTNFFNNLAVFAPPVTLPLVFAPPVTLPLVLAPPLSEVAPVVTAPLLND